MKWSFLYFVTFLSVLCGSVLGDYTIQNNNRYPLMRPNGNGFGNGIDYGYQNGYEYPVDYYKHVNYDQPNGYTRFEDTNYYYSRYYDPYDTQRWWLNRAPLQYQKVPKFGNNYYDNLASRKHDRSLLENLNNYPVVKH